MRIASIVTGSALVALLAVPAAAQTRAGSVEVSAYGGYQWFDRIPASDTNVVGGRVAWNFTDMLGIEAYYDVAKADTGVSGGVGGLFDEGVIRVRMAEYGVDAVLNWGAPGSPGSPYVLVGLGRGTKDLGGLDYWETGVGYRYFLASDWAVRGDVRALGYDNSYAIGIKNFDIKATLGVSLVLGGS